ncbi:protein LNK1-like isoform X2 [Rutidosis leptorrhynchoides]|uniref:protein LNK1-like isoform X2 n=1 Tax=Rutidosis leptorrhynchoides TaxID=125765 RepID=UPI003A99D1AD
MSDLSIYELDDIIWDDFERNGNPSEDQGSEDKCEGGNNKKPRLEVASTQNNEGDVYDSGGVSQERDSETFKKEMKMVDTSSWSHTPNGVFSATDVGTLQNTSGYPPSHISQSDNLSLFSSDGNGKESNDLLYYGWPDIGNFEDVDTMLSNCDSSFGLGVTGNDDELVWFTSENPSVGYEDALKMDLKFPCSQPSSITNVTQYQIPLENDNKCLGPDFVGYVQSTYMHDNVPMQTTGASLMTDIKSETKGPTTPSGKESCNASQNQFGKENKIESQSQSDVDEIRKGESAEFDMSNVREGSSISSELDEISLEASSFRQLQQVMEQLDLRTKLCIRDSLYRLARSAEQRHNTNYGPSITEGTNKYTGLVDMETDTNPIDRTIAHLLFHRPSDLSNRATHVLLKENAKVHGSTMGPSVVANKLSCHEVENESDDKISSTGKN